MRPAVCSFPLCLSFSLVKGPKFLFVSPELPPPPPPSLSLPPPSLCERPFCVAVSGKEVAGFVMGSLWRYCLLCDPVKKKNLPVSVEQILRLGVSAVSLYYKAVISACPAVTVMPHGSKSGIQMNEMYCTLPRGWTVQTSFFLLKLIYSVRGVRGEMHLHVCTFCRARKGCFWFLVMSEWPGLLTPAVVLQCSQKWKTMRKCLSGKVCVCGRRLSTKTCFTVCSDKNTKQMLVAAQLHTQSARRPDQTWMQHTSAKCLLSDEPANVRPRRNGLTSWRQLHVHKFNIKHKSAISTGHSQHYVHHIFHFCPNQSQTVYKNIKTAWTTRYMNTRCVYFSHLAIGGLSVSHSSSQRIHSWPLNLRGLPVRRG